MNHRMKGRKFGRTSSHRKAMLCNLSKSLVHHESIQTTVAKAKDLRPIVEKLITKARRAYASGKGTNGYLSSYRDLRSFFFNDDLAVNKIIEISSRFKDHPGGYLRIIKSGFRYGDNAPMAIIQFIDYVPVIKIVKDDDDSEESAA